MSHILETHVSDVPFKSCVQSSPDLFSSSSEPLLEALLFLLQRKTGFTSFDARRTSSTMISGVGTRCRVMQYRGARILFAIGSTM